MICRKTTADIDSAAGVHLSRAESNFSLLLKASLTYCRPVTTLGLLTLAIASEKQTQSNTVEKNNLPLPLPKWERENVFINPTLNLKVFFLLAIFLHLHWQHSMHVCFSLASGRISRGGKSIKLISSALGRHFLSLSRWYHCSKMVCELMHQMVCLLHSSVLRTNVCAHHLALLHLRTKFKLMRKSIRPTDHPFNEKCFR